MGRAPWAVGRRGPADGRLTEEQAGCIAAQYAATDLPRRSLVSGYDEELDDEIDTALAQAYSGCVG